MLAIKDMKMPSCCWGYKENGEDYECPLYYVCKNRDSFLVNNKPSDCPLVEIEERKTGKWLSAEEYALKIGAEVTEDIKNSLYKFCPFCEQTVFTERNYCPNCGAKMISEVRNENN